jgi:ABC-2 type transport system permease protein
MSGSMPKALAFKERHGTRPVIARGLLFMSVALRQAARRLHTGGDRGTGHPPAPPSAAHSLREGDGPHRGGRRNAVFWAFLRKDLYFSFPLIAGAFAAGGVALGLLKLGATFAAGFILFCAAAAPAPFLCMFLIAGERQERSHLFALSLPISPVRYMLAKVLAVSIAYAVAWLGLGAGTVLWLASAPLGAGLLPYLTVVWLFVLDQYCGMLAVFVARQSVATSIAAMIVFNTSPALFFNYVAHDVPAGPGAVAVWSPYALQLVTIELAVAAAFFAMTLWAVSRHREQS